jgi:hypothetical protein
MFRHITDFLPDKPPPPHDNLKRSLNAVHLGFKNP